MDNQPNLRGHCLVSQEIRSLIDHGIFVSSEKNLEKRIQPSSFEPAIGDEVFILDTDPEGLFRAQENDTIYSTLLKLPWRKRRKASTSDGFEIKTGHTYLFPLEERVNLSSGLRIKASPKSSCGRLFLNTRLVADFHSSLNEVYRNIPEVAKLWLLVQPLAFDCITRPGLSLNQIRFFQGRDVILSESEVLAEYSKQPFLYLIGDKDQLIPKDPTLFEGLRICLDISGKRTSGIVGLMARNNPLPIDLSKTETYDAEDYFEPMTCKEGTISLAPKQHCLLSSKEIIYVPPHLNMELRDHSHTGINGPLHFAGFIDNGFEGDVVFEVRSDEVSTVILRDGMPISTLDVYRCNLPDRVYGEKVGSHYMKQIGPRPAKYFKPFDFKRAGREYQKLDKEVIVEDANILRALRIQKEGFEPIIDKEQRKKIIEIVEKGFFQSRYDCEQDELILQTIPYVVVFGENNTVFSYVRASDIKDYGDKRLFGKHSIGLGGHPKMTIAGPETIKQGLEREVFKEEVEFLGEYTSPVLVGTLFCTDKDVDRVHFGLIYAMNSKGEVKHKEKSGTSLGFLPISDLRSDPLMPQKYETWSRVLVPHLDTIKLICNKSLE